MNDAKIIVHVRRNFANLKLEFFVLRRLVDGLQILQQKGTYKSNDAFLGSREEWVTVLDQAAEQEPTYSIEPEVWVEMMRAAEGMVEASAAGERHLSDAIAIRDRLLTLVERGWDVPATVTVRET